MERYLRIVKIFNVVAGVLILLGVVALVWLLVDRGSGTRSVADGGSIALPAGFQVKHMAATSDHLFLLLEDEAGAVLLLRVDPRDPAASASFVIETARP